MLDIVLLNSFKKDLKLAAKRHLDLSLLDEVISTLASGRQLDPKYKDHQLIGDYAKCRECHITSDWLLIYQVSEKELVLLLVRTGTHSDLF